MKLNKQTQIKAFLITVLAVFSMSSIAGIFESSDNNKIKYINGYTVWNGSVEDYIPDVKQFEKRLSNWKKCANKPDNNIEYLNCTNRTQFILDNSMPGYIGAVSVWDLDKSEHLQPLEKIILNRVTAASCGRNNKYPMKGVLNWKNKIQGLNGSVSPKCNLVMLDKAEEFALNYIMWDNQKKSRIFVEALERFDVTNKPDDKDSKLIKEAVVLNTKLLFSLKEGIVANSKLLLSIAENMGKKDGWDHLENFQNLQQLFK